jgi:hypothetical protein
MGRVALLRRAHWRPNVRRRPGLKYRKAGKDGPGADVLTLLSQSVLSVFLTRCYLPSQWSTRHFKRQPEAPSKVNQALSIFESPRGALFHSIPVGRDAFNTGDVAAGRDINPVLLGPITVDFGTPAELIQRHVQSRP